MGNQIWATLPSHGRVFAGGFCWGVFSRSPNLADAECLINSKLYYKRVTCRIRGWKRKGQRTESARKISTNFQNVLNSNLDSHKNWTKIKIIKKYLTNFCILCTILFVIGSPLCFMGAPTGDSNTNRRGTAKVYVWSALT